MHRFCELRETRPSLGVLLLAVLVAIAVTPSALGEEPSRNPKDRSSRPGLSGLTRCEDRGAPATAPMLARSVSLELQDVALIDAVSKLQNQLGVPVSFITGSESLRLSARFENVELGEVLRTLIQQAGATHACAVIDGHILVFPRSDNYAQRVRGVDIVDQYRGAAVRRYLDLLNARGLLRIAFLAGGVLESEVFSEKVSLRADSMVLEHLVQILGENQRAFFVIREAATGESYLSFGSVALPVSDDSPQASEASFLP